LVVAGTGRGFKRGAKIRPNVEGQGGVGAGQDREAHTGIIREGEIGRTASLQGDVFQQSRATGIEASFHRADIHVEAQQSRQAALVHHKRVGGGITSGVNCRRAGQGRRRLSGTAEFAQRSKVRRDVPGGGAGYHTIVLQILHNIRAAEFHGRTTINQNVGAAVCRDNAVRHEHHRPTPSRGVVDAGVHISGNGALIHYECARVQYRAAVVPIEVRIRVKGAFIQGGRAGIDVETATADASHESVNEVIGNGTFIENQRAKVVDACSTAGRDGRDDVVIGDRAAVQRQLTFSVNAATRTNGVIKSVTDGQGGQTGNGAIDEEDTAGAVAIQGDATGQRGGVNVEVGSDVQRIKRQQNSRASEAGIEENCRTNGRVRDRIAKRTRAAIGIGGDKRRCGDGCESLVAAKPSANQVGDHQAKMIGAVRVEAGEREIGRDNVLGQVPRADIEREDKMGL
jgi:hypothetical protein